MIPRFLKSSVAVRGAQNLDAPVDLAGAEALMGRILDENVNPFWLTEVLDSENGGYRLNHDVRGRWRGPASKRLVTQARVLWYLARLIASGNASSGVHALARHGLTFLTQRMWDGEWGGFFWEVDATGRRPSMTDKHAYGQAQALYALSEYALATGCSQATALAHETFRVMEEHLFDRQNGGYLEFLARNWAPAPAGRRGYLGAPPEFKLANTHLHLIEAFTGFARLTGEAVGARARLAELVERVSTAYLRAGHGCMHQVLSRQWAPVEDRMSALTSYGHDVEMVHILIAADEVLGRPGGNLPLCRTLFDHALRFGEDRREGGLFVAGPPGGPASDRRKIGWVQAEALLAAIELFRVCGESECRDAFLRTLRWIAVWQVDWRGGSWHAEIVEGRAYGPKVRKWDGPYHSARALIQGLDSLRQIAERSSVGGAAPSRPIPRAAT